MYIRRKVFSVALDENSEERYFSTNEFISEEDYLNEVMYSKKRKRPRHLTESEKDDLANIQEMNKYDRKTDELMYEGDREKDRRVKRKLRNKVALRDAGKGALEGAGIGTISSGLLLAIAKKGGYKPTTKDIVKVVGGSAAGGGILGGAITGAGSRTGLALRDKLSKKDSFRREYQRQGDLYKVSQNKMDVNTYKRKYKGEE